MSEVGLAPALAFLRRAGLLAAVLAVIAGIFGMHVLSTTHTLHSPAPAAAAVNNHHGSSAAETGAHKVAASVPLESALADDGVQTVQCADSGNCATMQAMTAPCIPSARSGSLSAPLPGAAIIEWNTDDGGVVLTSAQWAYRPGSPSPGDLCISRT